MGGKSTVTFSGGLHVGGDFSTIGMNSDFEPWSIQPFRDGTGVIPSTIQCVVIPEDRTRLETNLNKSSKESL